MGLSCLASSPVKNLTPWLTSTIPARPLPKYPIAIPSISPIKPGKQTLHEYIFPLYIPKI
jgi:hypothetical protein